MKQVKPIFKREFAGYFRTPVAYVFLVAFLVMSVALAFSRFGGFFKAGIASLDTYFGFYPWLFLFIVPAAGMRLWSEEKRSGTSDRRVAWRAWSRGSRSEAGCSRCSTRSRLSRRRSRSTGLSR